MRRPRQYSEEGIYHTYARGINKQVIFYDSDDKEYMLCLIKKIAKKYSINVHTYILMDNHLHLEITDPLKNLSKFMGQICSLYAKYFNKKYDRVGSLFQSRFGSEIIESIIRFINCCRYIIQNPEKAGICKAKKYRWSSYDLYKLNESWISRDYLLEYFGNTNNLYDFFEKDSDMEFMDLELRPSEQNEYYANKIKKILKIDNPMIPLGWKREKIIEGVRKLRKAGLSMRLIARMTGVSMKLIRDS